MTAPPFPARQLPTKMVEKVWGSDALLALPLAGEVKARDGSARAGAGECLVFDGLASLDFSRAEITLLTS